VGKKKKNAYKQKTDQEIKDLALELFRGNIITDRQIVTPGQDPNLLFSVFMPIALSGPELATWMEENNIDLMYGKVSETLGGRTINGWPIFTSTYLLNKEDTIRLSEAYDKIQKAMEAI
jgi:hypothetical protein